MLTVVTGASGHIGCNLVRELLSRGRRVRVLVRKDLRGIEGLEVEQVVGDVLDPGSLAKAFAGAEVVFHCAANISVDGSQGQPLLEVNVKGPRNVARACLDGGVRRLIHFSSLHAISESPRDRAITEENDLCTDDEHALPYSLSKAAGELEILAAVGQGLDAVIVNPSGVIGPHDYKLSHMGETVRDLATGRLPALIPGGYDFVDVRDVVTATIAAEEMGRTGERYLLTGHYVTVRELAGLVHDVTGQPIPSWICPMWLARAAAPFSSMWGRMRCVRPKFTGSSLQVLRGNGNADHGKATRELAHSPRPTSETIRDTIAWQKKAGLVP